MIVLKDTKTDMMWLHEDELENARTIGGTPLDEFDDDDEFWYDTDYNHIVEVDMADDLLNYDAAIAYIDDYGLWDMVIKNWLDIEYIVRNGYSLGKLDIEKMLFEAIKDDFGTYLEFLWGTYNAENE